MKKVNKIIIIIFTILLLSMVFSSCSEAEKVNHNISKSADYFDCERRVTVYNARTDLVIFYIEGYISINNSSYGELVVTCKVGDGQYKKNYVYLNDYTLYVVEDISGTHSDPYHYKVYFHSEFPIDVDVKP